MAEIILKDGSKKEFADGISLYDAVQQLSNSLAKKVLVAKVDGVVTDLRRTIVNGSQVEFCTFDSQEGKDTLRHSAAHIMAQAIKRLYSDVKLAIGPAIQNGFYYDLDTEHRFAQDDFADIEAEMNKIVKENLPITAETLSRDEAIKLFTDLHEDYKVELINDLPADVAISIYRQGEYVDLCAGPHVERTGQVKPLNCNLLPGPIGAAMKRIKCCSEFTERLLKTKINWKNI